MNLKKYLPIVYILMYLTGIYILWDGIEWGKAERITAAILLCVSALVCYVFHMYIDKNK